MAILDFARKALEQTVASNAGRTLFFFLIRSLTGMDFERVGTVRDLELDLRQGSLKAKLDLKGDPTPLVIEDCRFMVKVKEEEGRPMLEIASITTDRAWINSLLDLALPRSVELDPKLAGLLKLLQ